MAGAMQILLCVLVFKTAITSTSCESEPRNVAVMMAYSTSTSITPSQTYDVTLFATSQSGDGERSVEAAITMDPDSVKNLAVTQSSGSETTQLDVKWDRPDGRGEAITINYVSMTDPTASPDGSISVNFDATSGQIPVVPGHNYTISVVVTSNGLDSSSKDVSANSKPDQPNASGVPGQREVTLSWDDPVGNVDFYEVQRDGEPVRMISSTERGIVLDNLSPNTDYTITVYAVIIGVDGMPDRSSPYVETYTTLTANDAGLIVGIFVLCLAIVIVVLGVFYYRRRKSFGEKRISQPSQPDIALKNVSPPHMKKDEEGYLTLAQVGSRPTFQRNFSPSGPEADENGYLRPSQIQTGPINHAYEDIDSANYENLSAAATPTYVNTSTDVESNYVNIDDSTQIKGSFELP